MGLWINTIDRILNRHVEKTDGCWIWKAKKDYGYGRVNLNGKSYRAHRLMYEVFKGPIPEGLVIDHLCRNHSCVNPDHLEAVTQQENALRGISIAANNAKKTHCKYGHELSGRNLIYVASVHERQCRECKRRRTREWKARQRALVIA